MTDDPVVDDLRVGRSLRALRRRRHLRQEDLGASTRVAQSTISLVERGHLDALSIRTLRRVFAGLDADLRLDVRWRGGALDRLLDERHAAATGVLARLLVGAGWVPVTEVTFNHFGDLGSIDVLAWHAPSRVLLVVEVKTEIASLEETLRRLDVKCRLGPLLGRDRFDARPAAVVRLLAVVSSTANRERLARVDTILAAALPLRGMALRLWLDHPVPAPGGLLFVRLSNERGTPARRPGGRSTQPGKSRPA